MYRGFLLLSLAVLSALAGGSPPPKEEPPSWAYPVNPSGSTEPPDDSSALHVPDSDATFTLTQIRDLNFCPDWHPGDHPPMPDIVAQGRRPAVLACGSCHRADGSGGPENARVAGLPAPYIVQQMADFKSGARKTDGRTITSSISRRIPTGTAGSEGVECPSKSRSYRWGRRRSRSYIRGFRPEIRWLAAS